MGSLLVLIGISLIQWSVATYVASARSTRSRTTTGSASGGRGRFRLRARAHPALQRLDPRRKGPVGHRHREPAPAIGRLRRPLVETAGYGPDSSSGSQSAVPLAETDRVYRFAESLTGVESPRFRSPPTLARRRYLVRYAIVAAAVVTAAFGLAQVSSLERWYLAAVVFAAVPPAAHLKYVNLGYFVGEDHLVIRSGFWKRRTTVVPYYRIQTVSTRRSIFQRRLSWRRWPSTPPVRAPSRGGRRRSTISPLETARDVHGTGRERLQTALRERARENDIGLSVDFT